ncbi:heme biosynthesis protein HemY [Imbroritus primus]|uniref:Heme biosynthesis protein HemY n=1 Tax=Imbroritus primus TaxID=3058603 RepID=A0ACD3SKL8_9BURK|nr:heme biosynthesis protein HemY [Burkholderiaceae bacterium PBA]
MRILFWLAIVVSAAVGLALFTQFNHSNVVIFYPPHRIELSLNFALLLLFLTFLVIYTVLRTINHLLALPQRAAQYRERKRMLRAQAAMRESMEMLFAGRFGRAERLAREAQAWEPQVETAALVAARAAHRMQEGERRDAWLAEIAAPEREQAKLVSSAEMLVDDLDADAALEKISQLQAAGMRQIHVQRIALRAHQHLKNWPEVLRIARALDKRNALHPTVAARLKRMACEAMLDERRHDADRLRQLWQELSVDERRSPPIAAQAAGHFAALGQQDEARKIVEEALKAEWDGRLVRRYAECAVPGKALPLIQQAEKWQVDHPVDADLFYTLGILCLAEQLWGKAQASLERSLKYADPEQAARLRAQAHLALARLFEETERPDEAQRHYRAAAQCALE